MSFRALILAMALLERLLRRLGSTSILLNALAAQITPGDLLLVVTAGRNNLARLKLFTLVLACSLLGSDAACHFCTLRIVYELSAGLITVVFAAFLARRAGLLR